MSSLTPARVPFSPTPAAKRDKCSTSYFYFLFVYYTFLNIWVVTKWKHKGSRYSNKFRNSSTDRKYFSIIYIRRKRHLDNSWDTRKITVCSSTFYGVAAKITVHTVKFTGTHFNFSSATMNHPNVTMNYSNAIRSPVCFALYADLNNLFYMKLYDIVQQIEAL